VTEQESVEKEEVPDTAKSAARKIPVILMEAEERCKVQSFLWIE